MLAIAEHIALALADYEHVVDLCADERISASRGLSGGAGVAIFFAAMLQHQERQEYRTALQDYLRSAAHAQHGALFGLFSGLYGLSFASQYAMKVEPRYIGLYEKTKSAIEDLESRRVNSHSSASSFGEYDIISGRAGEAIALAATSGFSHARAACDYLAWVLENEERWHCLHPLTPERGQVHDLGVAHGVAGMIAALVLAGSNEPRHAVAIRRGIDSLLARGPSEARGWPVAVDRDGPRFATQAWCYGTPGCALTLLAAGARLEDQQIIQVGRRALTDMADWTEEEWVVKDFALCHGHAGNALIFTTAARLLKDDKLRKTANRLVDITIGGFDADSAFGFRSWTTDGFRDAPNLLEGSAGIGLALLTLSGECDPSWMAAFGHPGLRQPDLAEARRLGCLTGRLN